MRINEFSNKQQQEAERTRQEQLRNRGRLARYNVRRINSGLAATSQLEYCDWSDGRLAKVASSDAKAWRELRRRQRAVTPQHRDRFLLSNR